MESYLFQGVIHPQRAQFTYRCALGFRHYGTGVPGTAHVNILLNQVAVWVDTEEEWGIYDLRNLVRTVLEHDLAIVGYLTGCNYDVEITRVINRHRGIDQVYGVDTPCIVELNKDVNVPEAMLMLRQETVGPNGIFLNRCFNDLASAMKDVNDTAFYCYRAIESLRHHAAAVHGLGSSTREAQWQKLHELSGNNEAIVRALEFAATPSRHGEPSMATDSDRANSLKGTWTVVGAYLANVEPFA